MQPIRLIKGKSYLIDNIPHIYQERENGIYKFLKIDGSQKYLYEKDIDKVKPTLQDEAYEQKLRDAESEISYYKEKYMWYQEKEWQEQAQKKHIAAQKKEWFSDSKFVQVSTVLTMVGVLIVAFKISIETGKKSENFGVGLLTFASILIGGFVVSLLVGWIAYKAEDFVDEERKTNLTVKLIVFLSIIWFVLFKIFQILFISKSSE